MPIYLNDFDEDEICFYEYQHDRLEYGGGFVSNFGQWHDSSFELREDMRLTISRDIYSEHVVDRWEGSANYLKLQFCVSGGIQIATPHAPASIKRIADGLEATAGQSLMLLLSEPHEVHFPAIDQQTQWVRLQVATSLFRTLQPQIALPKPWRALVESESSPEATTLEFCYQSAIISPAVSFVLQQILNCPLQGGLKRLYLEGKALELLSLQWKEWLELQSPPQSPGFRAEEVDKLHRAKTILTQRFQNPPSLLELAREVELNDFKLKRGFRELFETSVFGYVQLLRLEQAQQLLVSGDLAIAEVAHRVGYESVSHFGALFKRQFGMTPRAYRLAATPTKS